MTIETLRTILATGERPMTIETLRTILATLPEDLVTALDAYWGEAVSGAEYDAYRLGDAIADALDDDAADTFPEEGEQ